MPITPFAQWETHYKRSDHLHSPVSDDSGQEAREDEDSYGEKDEEVDESRGREVRDQDDEEDIEVDEEADEC